MRNSLKPPNVSDENWTLAFCKKWWGLLVTGSFLQIPGAFSSLKPCNLIYRSRHVLDRQILNRAYKSYTRYFFAGKPCTVLAVLQQMFKRSVPACLHEKAKESCAQMPLWAQVLCPRWGCTLSHYCSWSCARTQWAKLKQTGCRPEGLPLSSDPVRLWLPLNHCFIKKKKWGQLITWLPHRVSMKIKMIVSMQLCSVSVGDCSCLSKTV